MNVAARLTDAAKQHDGRVLAAIAAEGWDPAGTLDLRGVGPVVVYAPPTGTAAVAAEGGSSGCSAGEQRGGRTGYAGRPELD